jgi:hypothetical protein
MSAVEPDRPIVRPAGYILPADADDDEEVSDAGG